MPLCMLWHVRVVLCKLMAIRTNGLVVILIVTHYLLILRAGWHTFVKQIEGGHWLDDVQPYVVIHRLASTGKVRGVFTTIMEVALSKCSNIRIDTHRDNHIMQHCLLKNGFFYCGIIHLVRNGGERLAYQKV